MKIVVSRIPKPLSTIKLTKKSLMQEIGDFVVNHIRQRTEQGRDVAGRFFPALSPAYAKRKAEAIGSTRADLTVSGDMLNSLRAKVDGEGKVTVSVANIGGGGGFGRGGTFIQRSRSVSPAAKARFHQVEGAGASKVKRRFIGISQEAKATIIKFVRQHLKAEVRRYRTGGAA